MNFKSLKKKFAIAFFAQTISLVVSFFATFFLSKKLNVEYYGYYQLFLFFSTYAGISQLGISQGVYLAVAGKNYKSLDKYRLKSLFLQGLLIQLILLTVMMCFCLISVNSDDKIKVIVCFAFYCIVYLFHSYWSGILQSVNKSEIGSAATIIGKSVTFLSFLLLAVFENKSFSAYCIAYIGGELICAIVNMFYCRNILCCRVRCQDVFKLDLSIYTSGCMLLLASLISSLIVGINRIIVENGSGIESFGKVSMSISLSNFVILFAIQIGMVLFPKFVNMTGNEQIKHFSYFEAGITMFAPIIFVAYYPMKVILFKWLPSYTDSIKWTLLLVPYTILEIKNQVVYNNLEKAFRDEKYMFLTNFIAILICSAVNYFVINELNNFNIMFIVIDCAVTVKSIMLSRKICKKLDIGIPWWSIIENGLLIVVSCVFFKDYNLCYSIILIPIYILYCSLYYKILNKAR